jgi:hypothetical protein
LTGETPASPFFIRADPLKQTSQITMANPLQNVVAVFWPALMLASCRVLRQN